jgi:transcriptional regulator with GAF, ATPase, and Fis domain
MSEKIKSESDQISSLGFELIGESESFKQVIESVKQVAPTNITILITGESGTGKEIIARVIHMMSKRTEKALLTVNCGAIPEGILESELFGHEKGSFTGASETRKGYFELADGGTLFLDEIGEMPLATQVKLLRILEEKEYMRVGGTETKHANVRVIAATNKNLENAVRKGTFFIA